MPIFYEENLMALLRGGVRMDAQKTKENDHDCGEVIERCGFDSGVGAERLGWRHADQRH
jgi:hypothetical protein